VIRSPALVIRSPINVIARRSIALAVLLSGAGGCGLAPIEPDVCGNGVVEPQSGEDCDNTSPSCGGPLSAAPCRALCADDSACGAGARCGTDGVCRRPKGELVELADLTSAESVGFAAGDLDRDGCDDLVLSTSTRSIVKSFASFIPGDCAASERSFRASLVPSSELPAAPVISGSEDGRSLVVADRGVFGAGVFELELVGGDLASRAHLSVPLRLGDEPLNWAVTAPIALGDGSDAWLAIVGALPPPPPAPPPSTETSALFAARGHLTHSELVDPAFGMPPFAVVALAAGDVKAGGCDEIVYGAATAPQLFVASACPDAAAWTTAALPPIKLEGFAKLPDEARPGMPGEDAPPSSASIALVDGDGDGHLDVLVNDASGDLHIAYGLGDGRFHSTSPPSDPPDQTTRVLVPANDLGMSGDYVFAAWPGEGSYAGALSAVIVPIACPTRQSYRSPNCSSTFSNSCSATVGDVDGNGLPDIIFTEPQLPSFRVHRGSKAGGFVLSSHETSCPPRHVSVSDLDGDGLDDVALFDAMVRGDGPMSPVHPVVAVAFGSPLSQPLDPRVVAVFDPAIGRASREGLGRDVDLVSGRFLNLKENSGAQLAAFMSLPGPGGSNNDTGLAAARFESTADRRLMAPYYFSSLEAGASSSQDLHVLQMAAGTFAGSRRLAVVTLAAGDAPATERLWLIDPSAAALLAAKAPLEIDCGSCELAAIDLDGDGDDELVALGDRSVAIYQANLGSPIKLAGTIATSLDFRGDQHGYWGRIPRPVVTDLDGDGRLDILAMTGIGELVALWGESGGGPLEPERSLKIQKLLEPAACPGGAAPPCTGRPGFAVVELDGSALPEVITVAPARFEVYDVREDRALVKMAAPLGGDLQRFAPAEQADYTAVTAGDFDGDGVDDIAVARATTFFVVFRGKPLIP
jgi:hypothetical protein